VALALAPTVIAAPSDVLAQAVASSRAAPCGPLQRDPLVDHAAEIINQSTYTYLNHTAENVPADDGHPTAITKDVGIHGEKVTALRGGAHDTTSAIKGALLQGYSALPDCSYSRFGTSILYEEESDYVLAVVVLVGA
jgi:hypothetical protein